MSYKSIPPSTEFGKLSESKIVPEYGKFDSSAESRQIAGPSTAGPAESRQLSGPSTGGIGGMSYQNIYLAIGKLLKSSPLFFFLYFCLSINTV